MDSFHPSAILRCISTNTTWSIRVELVAVERGVRAPFHLYARCITTTGRVSFPAKCLSIHQSAKIIHTPVCLCVTACHIFFFSVMLNTVFFLLRSKVNKKDHGLTTANMDSGFSFGVGRNLDSCSICTDQVRNWGSKCHFSTFYFILFFLFCFVFLSIYISNGGSVILLYFLVPFESNVLYGCIFTCLLD